MKAKHLASITIVLMGIFLIASTWPVAAAPQNQAYYYTPTAGADGRIIYKTKAGDTCMRITLLTNTTQDQLASLNDLTDVDCNNLPEGMELVIGNVVPTQVPTQTLTPTGPTPTLFRGSGQICVYVFGDANNSKSMDAGESMIVGAMVGLLPQVGEGTATPEPSAFLTDPSSGQSWSGTVTSSTDPVCFSNIGEGSYVARANLFEGITSATDLSAPVTILPGDVVYVQIGVNIPSTPEPAATATPAQTGGGASILLIILIGVLAVIAVVFVALFFRFRK